MRARAKDAPGQTSDYKTELMAAVAALRVDEIVAVWQQTITALTVEVGTGSIGYVGFSGGAGIDICLTATEPRISVAAVGLAGTEMFPFAADAAPGVHIPLLFFTQWNDEVIPRMTAFDLFDRFGSTDKVLHANPGRYAEVPRSQLDAIETFMAGRLEAER